MEHLHNGILCLKLIKLTVILHIHFFYCMFLMFFKVAQKIKESATDPHCTCTYITFMKKNKNALNGQILYKLKILKLFKMIIF